MTGELFLDSNVLLYACSSAPDDAEKRRVAEGLMLSRPFALSAQVLQEFIANALRKPRLGISEGNIDATLQTASLVRVNRSPGNWCFPPSRCVGVTSCPNGMPPFSPRRWNSVAAWSIPKTSTMAGGIYDYLAENRYKDRANHITDAYHQAKKDGTLAELPDNLKPHALQVFQPIDSVSSEGALPQFGNNRASKRNILTENFHKKNSKTSGARTD